MVGGGTGVGLHIALVRAHLAISFPADDGLRFVSSTHQIKYMLQRKPHLASTLAFTQGPSDQLRPYTRAFSYRSKKCYKMRLSSEAEEARL